MLILADFHASYQLVDHTSRELPKHHWCFDAGMIDFCLRSIEQVEEAIGPVVTLQVQAQTFDVPVSWFILMVEPSTLYVDMIPVVQAAATGLQVFLMSPSSTNLQLGQLKAVDIKPSGRCVYPTLGKLTAMCHPVAEGHQPLACVIGPHDLHKHLSKLTAKELLL